MYVIFFQYLQMLFLLQLFLYTYDFINKIFVLTSIQSSFINTGSPVSIHVNTKHPGMFVHCSLSRPRPRLSHPDTGHVQQCLLDATFVQPCTVGLSREPRSVLMVIRRYLQSTGLGDQLLIISCSSFPTTSMSPERCTWYLAKAPKNKEC